MPVDHALSAEEIRHRERAARFIATEIEAAGGWISFERFMDLALYAPGLGYYSAGARKLGRDGDFTTAPEVSRLFGACIARQCAEILHESAGTSIVELGAGTGRLAVDVLSRLESLGRLPDRYLIVEVSADLRERQRSLLRDCVPHLRSRAVWIDAPPSEPFDGVILANEVLDALPVARFRWYPHDTEELGVALATGNFVWAARPSSDRMRESCARLSAAAGGWDAGYESEYCPRLGAWSESVARGLRRGAALWFDYGLPRPQYYLPERLDGTLICHFRHRAHDDPLVNPGLQDISAWVDFTALAEAGIAAGFELAGFTTQAHLLAGLAIDEEMQIMAGDDDGNYLRLASEAKRLVLPGEMGECFKAMAWTRGLRNQLQGFRLKDLRDSLWAASRERLRAADP